MTNVVLPEDNQILNYITTTDDSTYAKYPDSVSFSSNLSLVDDSPLVVKKSINIVDWDGISFTSRYIDTSKVDTFTLAFWVRSIDNGCLLIIGKNSTTWMRFYSDRCNIQYNNDNGPGVYRYSDSNLWHYITICGDRSNNIITSYVDGVNIGSSRYVSFCIENFRMNTSATHVSDIIMTNQCMFTGNFTPPRAGVINGG